MKITSLYSLLLGFLLLISSAVSAQTSYQTPPASIADLVNAPSTPAVTFSKDGSFMLLLERTESPSIEDLAQPELRIAGLRINPSTTGPSRAGGYTNLKIKKTATGEEIQVTGLPSPAKMSGFTFSLDERYLAFTQTEAKGISLWMVDLSTNTAKALTGPILNQVLGNSMAWLADNSLLIKAVNPARGKVPSAPMAPAGPTIQETSGKAAPSRTYQDLLANPHDEALFAYFMDSQLMRITLDGSSTAVGKPAMIKSMLLSPDKNYLLVESIQKPFSYLVPADRFPYTVEVWSSQGAALKTLAQLPLDEVRPTGFDATVSGIRNVNWRADAPATLYWAEAQDKGDPKIKVAERDIVFTLMAPFTGEKQKLVGTALRFGGISWSDDTFALLSERWSQAVPKKYPYSSPEPQVKLLAR